MNFFNLGIGEILFILVIALIVVGPGNMVKTARDAGVLIRKVTKSPYWQEIWATKRELNEIPKMLAKEANLNETIKDLNKDSQKMSSSIASTVNNFIKEVNQPLEDVSTNKIQDKTVSVEKATLTTKDEISSPEEPAQDEHKI